MLNRHSAKYSALASAVTAFTVAAVAAIAPGVALAAPSTTFTYTGGVQAYTVPAGVYLLNVTAVGATGGQANINGSAAGGRGGVVASDVPVTPGQVLSIYVGGNGAGGAYTAGGYNGGGDAAPYNYGSSGGGASDIRTTAGDLASRLLVAGGGGGSGAGYNVSAPGGSAGNPAGQSGGGANSYGCPGAGGTQSAGGTGGCANGNRNGGDGSLGQGGTAGFYFYPPYEAAGGGGGGYYGGGGGGSFAGGGGGSDFVEASAFLTSYSLDSTSTPSVTVQPIVDVIPNPASLTFAGTSTQGTSAPQAVTLTNVDSVSLQIVGESFDYSNGQNGDDYFVSSGTCGGTIAAGATCQLEVRFNPQGTGSSSSGMFINTTDNSGVTDVAYVALGGTATGLPQGPAGTTGTTGAAGSTGSAGSTGPQGPVGTQGAKGSAGTHGSTGNKGATGPRGLAAKYRFGVVFSCHLTARNRRVTCMVFDPGSFGRRLTANLTAVHNDGDSDADVQASGSARGSKAVARIHLWASRQIEAGAYLISVTAHHGRGTYTMRQRVYVR